MLKQVGGKWYLGQTMLSDDDVKGIKSQAISLQEIGLLEILLNEMDNLAKQRIYINSISETEIMFGKVMLYTTDIIRKKIQQLSSLQ